MSSRAVTPRPFTITVPDEVLKDLRERLARVRWPDEVPGSGWRYGTDLAYMKDLVAHWRDRYDWRRAEARRVGRSSRRDTVSHATQAGVPRHGRVFV